MRKPRTALMTAVAVAATATLSLSGIALAATGTLPGAADDHATTRVPASVQVTVPDQANSRGASVVDTGDETTPTVGDEATETEAPETAGAEETADPAPGEEARSHGAEVSTLARTTTEVGADKGAAISKLASNDRARAKTSAGEETEVAGEGETAEDATEATATPRRSETGEAARTEHAGADAR